MGIRLAGLLALWGLTGCAGAPDDAAGTPTPEAPHVALDRAEFGENDGGKPIWSATAATAVYRTTAKVAELKDVAARFYEDGQPVTAGKAPRATWDENAHDFALTDGVSLETVDGQGRVQARGARWDSVAGRLMADGGVAFQQGANRLTAARLNGDRALRRVALDGGVRGTFALGSGTIALWSGSTHP